MTNSKPQTTVKKLITKYQLQTTQQSAENRYGSFEIRNSVGQNSQSLKRFQEIDLHQSGEFKVNENRSTTYNTKPKVLTPFRNTSTSNFNTGAQTRFVELKSQSKSRNGTRFNETTPHQRYTDKSGLITPFDAWRQRNNIQDWSGERTPYDSIDKDPLDNFRSKTRLNTQQQSLRQVPHRHIK